MRTAILATGIAESPHVDQLLTEPAFRRATRNMAMAYAAVQSLLTSLPSEWVAKHAPTWSAVLGTSDGELDVTVQFLKIFGGSAMARPFLFQSSLHNATLGFLSERFGWRGAGATLCGYDTSGEQALEAASEWTCQTSSPYAVAIAVEGLVEGAGDALTAIYPREVTLREGAAAILLARAEASEWKPLAWYEGWDTLPGLDVAFEKPYYDASALELLARALQSPVPPAEVLRRRPDGLVSRLHLRYA